MIVLGIDTSMLSTGLALLTEDKLLYTSVIKNKLNKKTDPYHLLSLKHIHEVLENFMIINKDIPDLVAIESYFIKGGKGATAVSQARGVVKLWIATYGFKYMELAPQTIKKVITGRGHAEKIEIKMELEKMYPELVNEECFDITDAVGIALTALKRSNGSNIS